MFKRISVIGLGYIGLPTAAVIASRGHEVIGVDVNQNAVDTINKGRIHIVEPDLDIVVNSVVNTGKLRAVNQPEPADAFLVAVPTPFKDKHEPDLSFIKAASKAIAPVLRKGNLVVLESTSPVGATEQMVQWLAEARPDLKFPELNGEPGDVYIAHCPERVLPGQVLRELVENDRIIGGLTAKCSEVAKQLYRLFVQGELLVTDARTAEMAKLTENAFRDVNIAFANELSLICEKLGINVWELIEMANHHPRVNILQPGAGVGGHCIAVDPWFIVSSAPDESRVIRTARQVNDAKPDWVVEKVISEIRRRRPGKLGILGLAFKPNVDDLRESPALAIAKRLVQEKVCEQFLIVEPFIDELPAVFEQNPNVTLVDPTTALQECDLLVGLVRHAPIVDALSRHPDAKNRVLDFVNFPVREK